MQHYTSVAEVCSLLDRAIETARLLNSALTTYVWAPEPASLPEPEPPQPKPVVEPELPRRIAPVLTIKLADLNRERDRAQRRRSPPPSRPPPHKARPHRHRRELPEVEVIYRKGVLKRVS